MAVDNDLEKYKNIGILIPGDSKSPQANSSRISSEYIWFDFHEPNSNFKNLMNMIEPDLFAAQIPRGITYNGLAWYRFDGIEVDGKRVKRRNGFVRIPPFNFSERKRYILKIMNQNTQEDFEEIVTEWKNKYQKIIQGKPKLFLTKDAYISVDIPTPTVLLSLLMTMEKFTIEI